MSSHMCVCATRKARKLYYRRCLFYDTISFAWLDYTLCAQSQIHCLAEHLSNFAYSNPKHCFRMVPSMYVDCTLFIWIDVVQNARWELRKRAKYFRDWNGLDAGNILLYSNADSLQSSFNQFEQQIRAMKTLWQYLNGTFYNVSNWYQLYHTNCFRDYLLFTCHIHIKLDRECECNQVLCYNTF